MKKKLFLLTLLSIISISACGNPSVSENAPSDVSTEIETESIPETTSVAFDLESYKISASEFNDLVMEESVLLYNLGSHSYNYWEAWNKLGGAIDYDNMMASSYEWLEENSGSTQADVENKYLSIGKLYKSLITADSSGSEIEEIEQTVKDLYSTLDTFYLLVTSPSGDINSFASVYNDCITKIKSYNNTLTLLTEDDSVDAADVYEYVDSFLQSDANPAYWSDEQIGTASLEFGSAEYNDAVAAWQEAVAEYESQIFSEAAEHFLISTDKAEELYLKKVME